jgi:hypothetical protein
MLPFDNDTIVSVTFTGNYGHADHRATVVYRSGRTVSFRDSEGEIVHDNKRTTPHYLPAVGLYEAIYKAITEMDR